MACSFVLQLQITVPKGIFYYLKRIKTYIRSTMSKDRLNILTVINVEADILLKLDSEVITNFCYKKVRRKCFLSSSRTLFIHVSNSYIVNIFFE